MELMDMSSMAASIGVSVAVLRFLLCFVATIPVSFAWRIVPSRLGKHLYAAASGALLSYLSFGFSSNLHFLVPMTIGYASMAIYRPKCGIITFFLGFAYLIGCHVFYMSGDAWKEGGIDATGALMVLTLKVISCAMNYNDGMLKEEGLREAQKKNRLIQMPSLIEYFGYCLCCGSHFAGPVYEMKDYLQWTEGKGIWDTSEKRKQPSPFGATLRAILQAAICMALYLYLVPQYPLTRFTEPVYQEWGFLRKFSYQYMAGFTARWKYYFIWSISEASIIISGLGFSGWTDDASPKPKWDRAKNVDILGVELAKSAVQIPLVWNIQVSTWLRHYVYERLVQNGKKAGFFQLLATQTVSAVWHLLPMMISGALIMDAFLGNLQEAIFKMNSETTQMEMLFCSTVVGLPFLLAPMILTGELFRAWTSCAQHPYVYAVLVFEAMATFVGQVSVLCLIALFGAATTAMITTARKAVTLLLSYLIFTKPLTEQHGSGLLLIAMALGLIIRDPGSDPGSATIRSEKPDIRHGRIRIRIINFRTRRIRIRIRIIQKIRGGYPDPVLTCVFASIFNTTEYLAAHDFISPI